MGKVKYSLENKIIVVKEVVELLLSLADLKNKHD